MLLHFKNTALNTVDSNMPSVQYPDLLYNTNHDATDCKHNCIPLAAVVIALLRLMLSSEIACSSDV
jgi:hypothetical protein